MNLNWKALARDIAIVWVAMNLGGLVVGFVGAVLLGPNAIMDPRVQLSLSFSSFVFGIVGFTIAGVLVKVRRFRHLFIVAVESAQRGGEIDPQGRIGGFVPDGLREELVGTYHIAGHQQAPTGLVEHERMLRRLRLRLSHESCCFITAAIGECFVCGVDQRRYSLVGVPRHCIRSHRLIHIVGRLPTLASGTRCSSCTSCSIA